MRTYGSTPEPLDAENAAPMGGAIQPCVNCGTGDKLTNVRKKELLRSLDRQSGLQDMLQTGVKAHRLERRRVGPPPSFPACGTYAEMEMTNCESLISEGYCGERERVNRQQIAADYRLRSMRT